MTEPDDDWLRRQFESMTPQELERYYQVLVRRGRMRGKTIHHIDGNPLNNDPANLRVVDITENRKRSTD